MSEEKKTYNRGNKHAAKPEAEKVSGKGRVVVDLGELKTRIVSALEPGQSLKSWIVSACEKKLKEK